MKVIKLKKKAQEIERQQLTHEEHNQKYLRDQEAFIEYLKNDTYEVLRDLKELNDDVSQAIYSCQKALEDGKGTPGHPNDVVRKAAEDVRSVMHFDNTIFKQYVNRYEGHTPQNML